MPRISEFYGIVIRMYHDDHAPPHFHARYGGALASISIEGHVLRGELPPRILRLIREWVLLRRSELLENWSLARRCERLVQNPPLE